MIPSKLWFPTTLADIALWYAAFNAQIQLTGTTHGLTLAEVDQIKDDAAWVAFMIGANTESVDYMDESRTFRKSMFEDPEDGSTHLYPTQPTLTPPVAVLKRGIWQRVIEAAERIKASAGYTQAIGESYGIVGTSPAPISPGDVKPDLVLSAAVHGYLFSAVVSKREDADAWELWAKPGQATEFALLKTATGKSTDVTFQPGGEQPGPIQLEVYVQLKRNNANYGQPSSVEFVTVSP